MGPENVSNKVPDAADSAGPGATFDTVLDYL